MNTCACAYACLLCKASIDLDVDLRHLSLSLSLHSLSIYSTVHPSILMPAYLVVGVHMAWGIKGVQPLLSSPYMTPSPRPM
jgi:hypothetical protein